MLSLLSWIITGLIVGLIARALVPGRQAIGLVMTIVLGVVGACLGGVISTAIWPTLDGRPERQPDVAGVADVHRRRRHRPVVLRCADDPARRLRQAVTAPSSPSPRSVEGAR